MNVWRWKESWHDSIWDVLDGLGWDIFSIFPLGSWAHMKSRRVSITDHSFHTFIEWRCFLFYSDAVCLYPVSFSSFSYILLFSLPFLRKVKIILRFWLECCGFFTVPCVLLVLFCKLKYGVHVTHCTYLRPFLRPSAVSWLENRCWPAGRSKC